MQYYALSGLGEFDSCTRGDALRACPWLSYSAPSALDYLPRLRRWITLYARLLRQSPQRKHNVRPKHAGVHCPELHSGRVNDKGEERQWRLMGKTSNDRAFPAEISHGSANQRQIQRRCD